MHAAGDDRHSVEVLTEAFYAWERRGRGWQLWNEPVELEPPFRPFYAPSLLQSRGTLDDARKPTFFSQLTDRLLGVGSEVAAIEEELFDDEPEPIAGRHGEQECG